VTRINRTAYETRRWRRKHKARRPRSIRISDICYKRMKRLAKYNEMSIGSYLEMKLAMIEKGYDFAEKYGFRKSDIKKARDANRARVPNRPRLAQLREALKSEPVEESDSESSL